MTEFVQAYIDGNVDRAEEILVKRFPDAPPNVLAAVSVFLFLKVKNVEQLEDVEPKLDEVVDRIKEEWEAHGW